MKKRKEKWEKLLEELPPEKQEEAYFMLKQFIKGVEYGKNPQAS